ncbi:MAG: hypothetical protein EB103_05365 [Actinobacteria bacterium]|nr:hypothetical protein [Actinomycetota bacterium]
MSGLFPLLKKILVAFGDKIAFEDNLDDALNALFGGDAGGDNGGTTPEDPDLTNAQKLANALEDARQAILEKDAAMRAGNWTAYGKAEARLQKAIETAIALSKK